MGFEGEEHRSVADGTLTTVSVIASDGSVLLPGRGVARYLGAGAGARDEPIASRKVFASVVPGDRERAMRMFDAVSSGSRSVAAMSVKLERSDGTIRLADVQLVDHRHDPVISGILLITRDVTVERAKSLELSELREAERFLGEGARAVASVPFEELDLLMERLVTGAGELMKAQRLFLSVASDDRFVKAYGWESPGAVETKASIRIAGFSADLSRWMKSPQPRWIDADRLERRLPGLAATVRVVGDRLLIYTVRLSNGFLGVLSLWDPERDLAAEFLVTGLADLWSVVAARQSNHLQRQQAEARLETLLSRSSDLLIVHDRRFVITYVSPGSVSLLGFTADSAVGRSVFDYLHPEDIDHLRSQVPSPVNPTLPTVMRVRCAAGGYRTFEAFVSDLRDDVNVRGFVVNARDVTDLAKYKAELQRHRSLERLVRRISTTFATAAVDMTDELLVESVSEVLAFTGATRAGILVRSDDSDRYVAIHQVAAGGAVGPAGVAHTFTTEELRGVAPSLFDGHVVIEWAHDRERRLIDAVESPELDPITALLAIPLRAGEELFGVMVLTSTEPGWDCAKDYLGPLRTIGEIGAGALSRQRVERTLAQRALHDPLTGLANRRLLLEELNALVARSARDSSAFALMFVDCDGFKEVNDTHGHEQGDELLVAMARRLETVCGHCGTIARLGGDEFVVLVANGATDTLVSKVAEHVVEALKQPYEFAGRTVRVTVSVGVAMHDGRGSPIATSTLLRRADLAMYQAKQSGRNRVQFFNDDMESTTRARSHLLHELRNAISVGNEFEVWYQPVFDLAQVDGGSFAGSRSFQPGFSAGLVGFEALVRWRHGTRGLMQPAGFIDLAEESGLIDDIGWKVFETALEQLDNWRTGELTKELSIAVNISVRQMQSPTLLDRVRSLVRDSVVDPGLITFEVTESTLANRDRVGVLLSALRGMGIKIAIDDFGTGYSSLAYLRDLPLDILKIDRSFTRTLGTDPRQNAMVAMVSHLADQMGVETVAEGVETPSQLEIVRKLNCTYAQGFLLGRPMPAGEFDFGTVPLIGTRPTAG